MDGNSGSPLVYYLEGQFYATGLNVVHFRKNGNRYAGAISARAFSPSGSDEAHRALKNLGLRFGEGSPPKTKGVISIAPIQEVEELLLMTDP